MREHHRQIGFGLGSSRTMQHHDTTALHQAAAGGHLATVKLLLSFGADDSILDAV